MASRLALPVLLVLVVLAGCVGVGPTGDEPATETTEVSQATTEAPQTTVETPPPTDCGDLWVSFYAVGGDVQDRTWSPDAVSIGYTVPGNASVFFVAYEGTSHENGTVLGARHVQHDTGYPVTADGARVSFDSALSGDHTVRVVAHTDADGDGEFDRTEDPACLSDGSLAQTEAETFDFDDFAETTEE
ncbi:hypothetical protein [Halorussus amylolyticus]|uniref:hypothetical protein n=1 Tax=Halorussus amylolyticus TaxID=1126242 RepID=UPI0010467248|nr:hypothetical protein [Halorussus amylolyticus]